MNIVNERNEDETSEVKLELNLVEDQNKPRS